jgi:pimeloyl-ACP methyl ester carboxylesterase
VAPDLPGFGRSDPLAVPHTVVGYADAIEDFCDALDLPEVTVVGHSLGADIALALTARHPERVRSVIMISPVTEGRGAVARLARAYFRAGSVLPTGLARAWLLSRPAVYLSDQAVITSRDRDIRRRILAEDYRTAAAARPRAISESYLSLHRTPFTELADVVSRPAVLIAGDRDPLSTPASVGALHRRIRASRLIVMSGAGHLWPTEHPRAAGRVVEASLRGL